MFLILKSNIYSWKYKYESFFPFFPSLSRCLFFHRLVVFSFHCIVLKKDSRRRDKLFDDIQQLHQWTYMSSNQNQENKVQNNWVSSVKLLFDGLLLCYCSVHTHTQKKKGKEKAKKSRKHWCLISSVDLWHNANNKSKLINVVWICSKYNWW